jgi:ketosteroid isomerase-like protein
MEQVERHRFEAMVRGDLAALDRVLAEDLTYVHTTGGVDTKESFLAALESGAVRYVSIQPEEVRFRVYGAVAVGNGTSEMAVRVQGEDHLFRIRYTDVYAREGGQWRLVAWQSTRLPEG